MKKNASIYFDLITFFKTTQEVATFMSEIDALTPTFFKSETASLEKVLESINAELASKIMQIFQKNNLNIHDKDTVIGFFTTIKELLQEFKVIKLVLAFNPNGKTIEKIHNFVKENIGIEYILDIEVSEDILGGAVVIFNGNYHDFTLKKELEDAFTTKKQEILTLIQ